MLAMVSDPSLTEPLSTQVPSPVLLHALHGIRSMSPGQLCIVQTCASARAEVIAATDVIAATNAIAVRILNLDMFRLALRAGSRHVLAPFRPNRHPGSGCCDPKCVS